MKKSFLCLLIMICLTALCSCSKETVETLTTAPDSAQVSATEDKALIREDEEGLIRVCIKNGEAILSYNLEKWEALHQLVERADPEFYDISWIREGPFPIATAGGVVADACIGKVEALEYNEYGFVTPTVLLLMADGSVQYVAVDPYAELTDDVIYSRGRLLWLQDIISLSYEETGEGIGWHSIYATDAAGTRYDIQYAAALNNLQSGEWMDNLGPYGGSGEGYFGYLDFLDESQVKYSMGTSEDEVDIIFTGSYQVVLNEEHQSGYRPGTMIFDLGLEWTIAEGVDPRFPYIEQIRGAYATETMGGFYLFLYLMEGDPLYDNRYFPYNRYFPGEDDINRSYAFQNSHDSGNYGYNVNPNTYSGTTGDYFAGTWEYYYDGPPRYFYNGPEAGCTLTVAPDMTFAMRIYELADGKDIATYAGFLELIRVEGSSEDDLPDMVELYLTDPHSDPETFWIEEAVLHNGKRMIKLHPMEKDGFCFHYLEHDCDPGYLLLAKETGEQSMAAPRANDYFDAVYWGQDEVRGIIWLDDLTWSPEEGWYENPQNHSVAYTNLATFSIAPEVFYAGAIFQVETNARGEVVRLEYANTSGYDPWGWGPAVLDVLTYYPQVAYYLDSGMTALITSETTVIDGLICFDVALGTYHDEHFVQERHYAVRLSDYRICEYDAVEDSWHWLSK